ncbi:MAG: pyruvate, phosphate dikinase [Spirochaetales bacterium]|nr:pyruvate, phosphate dikinase [Spirochaetales bacterium]
MHYELDETWMPFSSLMLKHIYNVLLICSEYDRFMLEEDGRVEEELYREYTSLGLSNPPKITHTSSEEKALELLKTLKFDLVISMLDLGTDRVETFAQQVKEFDRTLPFIALAPSPDHRKAKILRGENCPYIDYMFYWMGDPSVFFAMIKLIEDSINVEHDTNEADVQVIIFVEDSVRFISSYLPRMYTLLIEQNRASIKEALNEWGTKLRMRGRPKILLARSYDEAIRLYYRYRQNVLGVITDLKYDSPHGRELAGEYLIKEVKKDNPDCPVLLQSTEKEIGEKIARDNGSGFCWKLSPDHYEYLGEYFRNNYDFGSLNLLNPETGETIATVSTMKELQEKIQTMPLDSFIYHTRRNDFSRWLRAQSLYQLASKLKPITLNHDVSNAEETRQLIYTTIKEYRKERTRGTIAEFNRDAYDETIFFARMGNGSLGGKGRGLAFIALEMKAASMRKRYSGIYVSIPRTVVISTEIFDQFMKLNGFMPGDFTDKHDSEVLTRILSGRLPDEFEKDLRKIVEVITVPMSVRSSSLLEDSHYQPFAGVYQTCMIPNKGTDEERLADLETAVKTVWASTYFKVAREYLKRTGHAVEEEKMAVVLQQVTGSDHGGYWFPNISGVARSLDYYPVGSRKAEDGIGMLAYGLGKTIVDEGDCFRFCPAKPKVPVSSMNGRSSSQTMFYALDINMKYDPFTDMDNLVRLELSKAYEWPQSLKGIFSVMTPYGYLSENATDNGFKSLTFNGIIKYDMIPLARIVDNVLKLGSSTMSEPVEIEFAVNLEHADWIDFSILQIRPISGNDRFEDVDISQKEMDEALISCSKVMGNGRVSGIRDIICVKRESFNRSEMVEMALELEKLNDAMEDQYVLVVAGRLGSSDSWLGIPCAWSQISKAHVIVETGLEDLQAEPSEGTHFFQNMTSLGCIYLSNNPLLGEGKLDFEAIEKLPLVEETKHFVHVRNEDDLLVKADGMSGKAVVGIRES